jgi:antitoxin StbD
MAAPLYVKHSREVRDHFGELLGEMRAGGARAKPVVFGSHRKPEAVMLSFEQWQALREMMDDVVSAVEVLERDRDDSGERFDLETVAARLGLS